MRNVIGALVILIIGFPTLLLSLQRGHININGLILDLIEVVGETVIRRDLDLSPQDPYQPPQPDDGAGE